MYGFYPLALLAGFLTWAMLNHIDKRKETNPARAKKTVWHVG